MDKRAAETYYPPDESSWKEFGRYAEATVEYSGLVMVSLLQRGANALKEGATAVAVPFQKGSSTLKQTAQQVMPPVKCLGAQVNKLFTPFRWSAGKLADAGNRGIPVHLDRDSLSSIRQGLNRIEERLARIEEKGFALTQATPHQPNADDFKEKPSKEKNMLFRAILEDSKETMVE